MAATLPAIISWGTVKVTGAAGLEKIGGYGLDRLVGTGCG